MGDDPEEIDEMFHINGEDSSDASYRVMSAGNSKEDSININNDVTTLFGGSSIEESEDNS